MTIGRKVGIVKGVAMSVAGLSFAGSVVYGAVQLAKWLKGVS